MEPNTNQEEIKTNIFKDQESKPESEVENEEAYSSLEEYFLDCCRDGDLVEFKDCLAEGVDIFWFDRNLNNALHMICANGHKALFEELMSYLNNKHPNEKNKFINHKNCDGNTPLRSFLRFFSSLMNEKSDWAVINRKLEIISLLVENKCDCSIANAFGKTPLEEALNLGLDNVVDVIAPHTKVNLDDYKDFGQDCEIQEVNGTVEDEDEMDKINKS